MQNTEVAPDDEISIKDIFFKLMSVLRYLKRKWIIVISVAIIGGIIGFLYNGLRPAKYTAESTFVLEDGNKGGGVSQFSGLASLAGIDLGGAGGGGIFQGDNILELYKSRLMLQKTLLSPVNIDGKTQLLIDRYVDFNNLRDDWKKNNIGNVIFTGDPQKFNRLQDSIVTRLIEQFNKKYLVVSKPDKKLSIIKVSFVSNDEVFAKEFNVKLVENVNDFYTQTKTKKSAQNVKILQKQVDSVKQVLNSSIGGVASAIDAAPNANPSRLSLRVPSQRREVDVRSNSSIYGEIVKNLELGKISLRQETPLIQVIDQPVFPLNKQKPSRVIGFLVGFFAGGIIVSILLLIRKFFQISMK